MLIVIGRPKTIKTRLVSVKIDLIITILTFYSNHIICCYIYSFILEFQGLTGPKKGADQGFCCPTVDIVSLVESQAGAFWCHEFLWSMERRHNAEKNYIKSFSWMLDCLLHKGDFDIMNGSNKTKTNICTIYGRLFINPSYQMFHTSWEIFLEYSHVSISFNSPLSSTT